jgi:CubicO group peptidase (beta-lactamase class C family)
MFNIFFRSPKARRLAVFSCGLMILLFQSLFLCGQDVYPGKTWEKVKNPEELGYSTAGLDAARKFADEGTTAAVVIVVNGKILYEWGEVERAFITHSARKSFLSAMYGKYIDNGSIDLDMTMKELGIDDVIPLSAMEKMATVRDCLKARSGVYGDAAAESQGMRDVKPERNSHVPGTYWLYNNWDFNVLGTIFEKTTGKTVFQGILDDLAVPLQMEHLGNDDDMTFKVKESIHAAYMFKISARDMARFGLLMLRQGNWNGEQIVPADWVKETTSYCSDAFVYGGDGYGYMWWVVKNNNKLPHFPFVELKEGAYSARGAYGQYILVIPEYDMVIVHRVNSFERGNNVSGSQFGRIVKKILMAGPEQGTDFYMVAPELLDSYVGQYSLGNDVFIEVSKEADHLRIEKTNRPPLEILPVSDRVFYATATTLRVRFVCDEQGIADSLIITQAGQIEYAERMK